MTIRIKSLYYCSVQERAVFSAQPVCLQLFLHKNKQCRVKALAYSKPTAALPHATISATVGKSDTVDPKSNPTFCRSFNPALPLL